MKKLTQLKTYLEVLKKQEYFSSMRISMVSFTSSPWESIVNIFGLLTKREAKMAGYWLNCSRLDLTGKKCYFLAGYSANLPAFVILPAHGASI